MKKVIAAIAMLLFLVSCSVPPAVELNELPEENVSVLDIQDFYTYLVNLEDDSKFKYTYDSNKDKIYISSYDSSKYDNLTAAFYNNKDYPKMFSLEFSTEVIYLINTDLLHHNLTHEPRVENVMYLDFIIKLRKYYENTIQIKERSLL